MPAGALVSALIFGGWGHRLPRRWTFTLGFLICGGPVYFVLASTPGLLWCVVAQIVAGLAGGGINPVLSTVMLERVPATMRARVGGVMTAGCWAAMPIGGLGAGLLAEQVGVVPALFGVGTAYLLVTLVPLRPRPWRELDRQPAADTPVPAAGSAGPGCPGE